MKSVRKIAGALCLLLLGAAASASAQVVTVNTPDVQGNTVNLSWAPVPGALIYGIQVQMVGGPSVGPIPIGAGTTFSVPNVPNGTYTVWIWASNGIQHAQSSPVTVVVGAQAAPPAAPTNLSAAISGNAVLLSWDLADASSLLGLLLEVGSVPGGNDLGTFPIRVSTSSFVPHVPSGTYYARLIAVGAGGQSQPSQPFQIVTPGCSVPTSIPLTAKGYGSFASLTWPQVPGAIGYRLDVSATPGGAVQLSQTFGPSQTSFFTPAPLGTYYLTLHTQLSCGQMASSAETPLTIDGTYAAGPRAPSGQPISSLNYAADVIEQIGNQYRGDLNNSCGNNTWVFRVLQALRMIDSRWGLNWKRGNFGDMSQDVITYNFSDLPDDQAREHQMYAWDIIGAHCTSSPRPQFANITDPSKGSAAWTILPYLQAGFAP